MEEQLAYMLELNAYRHDNPGLNATHQEVSDRYYRAITRGGG